MYLSIEAVAKCRVSLGVVIGLVRLVLVVDGAHKGAPGKLAKLLSNDEMHIPSHRHPPHSAQPFCASASNVRRQNAGESPERAIGMTDGYDTVMLWKGRKSGRVEQRGKFVAKHKRRPS